MEYRDVIADLIKRREERGWSRPALAAKLGISKQVLGNWETIRNRAAIEDLSRWSEELGGRLVFALTPADTPPVPAEVQAALLGMTTEQQQQVVEFAQTLKRVGARDYGLLTDVVAAMRASLNEDTSSGSSTKPD